MRAGEDGARQIKLIRFMISNLCSLLRSAPQALVQDEGLEGALTMFAKLKSLVPPCHPCLAVHQQLAPSIRSELSKHVSPLLDSLLHSMLICTFLTPASRHFLIKQLCCPVHNATAGDEEEDSLCDDAAGRLALVQSALHHVGTHTQDVQEAFVDCLPDLFRLLQTAAPHFLSLPYANTENQQFDNGVGGKKEEEADLLFRCCVMIGALLTVVPGRLRSQALRAVMAQVITGGAGEVSQEVAVHVWGLQLRRFLPLAAVEQHAQQLVLLLREAHCRGIMPHNRLQAYLAHLLVAALPTAARNVGQRIRTLLQPNDALRYITNTAT